jgi:hypothetical protein
MASMLTAVRAERIRGCRSEKRGDCQYDDHEAPMVSLDTVPQNRPRAAPHPASTLGKSGRPAHKSPSSGPAKAPRQAPVPTIGTGGAVPAPPPT